MAVADELGLDASTAADVGVLDETVRTSALVDSRPPQVRRRIPTAFERLAAEYATGTGLELPVSVKIAAGRK